MKISNTQFPPLGNELDTRFGKFWPYYHHLKRRRALSFQSEYLKTTDWTPSTYRLCVQIWTYEFGIVWHGVWND